MEKNPRNQDLAKIPARAFGGLDEHIQRHPKKVVGRPYQNNHNGREGIDAYEAAKKFGGMLIVEHWVAKKKPPQPVIRKHF